MSVTLAALCERHGNGKLIEFFERRYPSSYESFLRTVQDCIDRAVAEVQRAAQYLYSADEDTITTFIVSNLRSQQLDAEHDSDSGGHVDIFIQDADKNYSWAAEAKIDSTDEWVRGSIPQLMDRYAAGTVGANQGGVLIYIKSEDSSAYMSRWRKYVVTKYGATSGFAIADCDTRHPYAFFSECVFNKTGQPFRIRHVGVTLFRQASKDEAQVKAAEKQRMDHARTETIRLLEEAAVNASSLAKATDQLVAERDKDLQLKQIAEAARASAAKIDEAAKVAAGALPAKKRARAAVLKASNKTKKPSSG